MTNDTHQKQHIATRALFLILFLLLGIIVYLSWTILSRKDDGIAIPLLPSKPSAPSSFHPSDRCAGLPCPADIIDLTRWKVTLPVETGEESPQLLEIMQPELAMYSLEPWFMSTPDKKGVIFRAPVNASTTGNSDYPRSELREMSADGEKVAFWPSTTGTHTLLLDEAITSVPRIKPHVVAGQIHGDDDDLLVIRLEYPTLYIDRSKKNVSTLDDNYTLGKRFTIKFVAQDGQILVYYNGSAAPVYTLEKKLEMAYFKAGVYTQSNCETEESPELCAADNYGEVVIYRAILTHE